MSVYTKGKREVTANICHESSHKWSITLQEAVGSFVHRHMHRCTCLSAKAEYESELMKKSANRPVDFSRSAREKDCHANVI